MGREDHGKNGEGQIVRQEDEARESAVDDDTGRDQDHVRGVEEEHPPPRHRPVRKDPMVHQAVGDPQQHRYGQESDVLGIPEARPVGQQEDTDKPDEPAPPDRDPCHIQNDIRVGQGAWRNPFLYGFYAGLQQARAPDPESPTGMRLPGCALTLQIEYTPYGRAISRRLPLITYTNSS